MHSFYNLAIRLYTFTIRLAAVFNPKARQWLRGRRRWRSKLQATRDRWPEDAPILWIHCASLGEFEQGRPVIEALKEQMSGLKVALTFFSPSGYELRKNYESADLVAYLPADTPAQARDFVALLRPRLAIFVKYEFWYNCLLELHHRGVPTLLISALFRRDQVFFQWYGGFFRTMLPLFDRIFVQNQSSGRLLAHWGIAGWSLAGDTRIDRVMAIRRQSPSFPIVEAFAGDHPVLIAGSTWAPDESILEALVREALPAHWKLIIAPHRITEADLKRIEQRFPLTSRRYSRAEPETAAEPRLLIIDNIGMLSALYQYGRVAYVGGGFGVAIHNTLEPIAFGLPVLFGPRYHKFEEAVTLVHRGGAFPVKNSAQLISAFRALLRDDLHREASRQAEGYIMDNQGATQQIVDYARTKLAAIGESG